MQRVVGGRAVDKGRMWEIKPGADKTSCTNNFRKKYLTL